MTVTAPRCASLWRCFRCATPALRCPERRLNGSRLSARGTVPALALRPRRPWSTCRPRKSVPTSSDSAKRGRITVTGRAVKRRFRLRCGDVVYTGGGFPRRCVTGSGPPICRARNVTCHRVPSICRWRMMCNAGSESTESGHDR